MHLIQLRRVGETQIHQTRLVLERLRRLNLRRRISVYWMLPALCVFLVLAIIWQFLSIRNFVVMTEVSEPLSIRVRQPLSQFDPGLFGLYVSQKNVQKSNLAFTVIGIGYSDRPNESVVILRSSDGLDHLFHEGDLLPFGAKIHSIKPSEVLFERQDMLEKLILNKD